MPDDGVNRFAYGQSRDVENQQLRHVGLLDPVLADERGEHVDIGHLASDMVRGRQPPLVLLEGSLEHHRDQGRPSPLDQSDDMVSGRPLPCGAFAERVGHDEAFRRQSRRQRLVGDLPDGVVERPSSRILKAAAGDRDVVQDMVVYEAGAETCRQRFADRPLAHPRPTVQVDDHAVTFTPPG